MKLVAIGKQQTNVYKGIAIAMIAIHNFMHLLEPSTGENEFSYNAKYTAQLLEQLSNHPIDLFRIILSYFGHFGVQIFIFLSAYGLSVKYIDSEKDIDYLPFFLNRSWKIYPAFILAIILWSFVGNFNVNPISLEHGIYGWFDELLLNWRSLVYKLLLISPFIEGEALSLEGPWWFISFIFQFYLVFPILIKFEKAYKGRFLLAASIGGIVASPFMSEYFEVYMTPLGHLPELCLGMYLARKREINYSPVFLICVVAIYVLGNLNSTIWTLSHISMLFILLVVFQWYTHAVSPISKSFKFISFIGTISLQIFLINGTFRYPFIKMAEKFDSWFMDNIFAVICFSVVMVIAYILYLFEARVRLYLQ